MNTHYDVMRHYLIIDGKSTKDFGVYLSGDGTFKAPEKNVEEFTIPGRNGTFHYTVPNTYKNVTVPYDCFIFKDFKRNVADFRSFLLSRNGYVRIEDTHHPGEFRMGTYHEEFAPDVFVDLKAAQFTINFDCKPERWLKSGEEVLEFSGASSVLENPTYFEAKPLITLYGEANTQCAFNIKKPGDASYETDTQINFIMPDTGFITIDTEIQEVYADGTSYNNIIYFSTTKNPNCYFPTIKPESNDVRLWNLTRVEIIPRWWIL